MVQKNVPITTLQNPDLNIEGEWTKKFEKKVGLKVNIMQDMCQAFDNKDIHILTVARPEHWHMLSTIWVCQAFKVVYVEKPASHNIWEGRKMVEATYKYDHIIQQGIQLHSSVVIREAIQLLRDKYIGKVYLSRDSFFWKRADMGNKQFEPAPTGSDYDPWASPASKSLFIKNHSPL